MCRASKIVPDEIVENFKMDHEPSVKVLIESLLEVSQSFSRVVMSIDAIDESQKRESFAKLLKKMATDDQFERFRLVITSRPEANIQSQLSALPTISMSNTLVDADIVVYVDQQLNSDSKFQRWSPVLREDIKLALSKGAHGMFRWAACQLGVLRRLNLEWDVRRALTQLPDTLDETYERMLASIAPENKGLVLRALAILCSDTPLATSIRPGALLSALSMPEPAFHFSGGDAMNVGTAGLDDSSSLTFVSSGASDANRQSWLAPSTSDLTIEDLKEMASGLLRITNLTQQDAFTGQARAFDVVTLAHYTVKEYLFSSRSACGSASYFHLSATIATRYCITCIMRAVAWWPLTSRPTAFVAHCSQVWALNAVHADALIASDDELFGLVCQLLDPSLPHYPALVQRGWRDLTAILKSWRFGVPPTTTAESSSSAAPTSCAAGVLTNMVSLGLNLTTTAFLLRHSRKEVDTMAWAAPSVGGPWPVICDMAQNGNNWPLELLIRRGATLRNGHGSLILHAMRRYIATERTLATIRTLLVAGARPDADEDDGDFTVGVHLTPLQLAAYRLQPGVVKLLLEAGADPNRVGRAGGWVSDASLRNWNGDVSPLRIARRRRTHILKYGRPERPTRDVVELLKAAGAKAHPTGPDDNDDDFDDCVSVRVVEVEMSVE